MKRIRICVAGITGWAGRPVAEAIAAAPDLRLVSGVSRSAAGKQILGAPVFGAAREALDASPADVLVDFTSAEAVKEDVLAALGRGVHVVNGSSGLTAEDYAGIDRQATERRLGVIALANASLMAALLQRFAVQAAGLLPSWEIVDYASADKLDAPSGTSRQLAERLGGVRTPMLSRPIDQVSGAREARGATIAGTQVHSVRLPSYLVSTEVIFAQPGERLVLRHEPGESAAPYVAGTLVAVRAVVGRVGLVRGLDALLFP
ncbi:MAG TPA: dihydrodipicolinate reductase C-terminal domain-containing protein [Candidatus Dormibacteraeota bacterium]|nr:dihydrodipicolinate reductase C-terminal domain-containing protein [Candidatus Dormibacteraeota bacterium]